MSLPLPGKKVQALIIIITGTFLAYFISIFNVGTWFHSLSASVGKAAYTSSLDAVSSESIDSDLDTDSDGLKDWQESLWGSDKNKKDSDADGANDGDEIEKGRDPSIKGPDDSLEKTRGISASSVTAFSATVSADPNNLSQAVSRDLFAKFMSLQSNGALNDTSQAELVTSVINDINPGSIPPRYSVADVNITETSVTSLRAYGNEIASAMIELQNKNTAGISNKDSLALYVSVMERIRKAKVPGTLGLTHLQLLNNFNAMHQMLILLANFESDPVKSLVAMKSIQTSTKDTTVLLASVASELQNNGILFDKTEAGYIWNNYR